MIKQRRTRFANVGFAEHPNSKISLLSGVLIKSLMAAPLILLFLWVCQYSWSRLNADIYYNSALAKAGTHRRNAINESLEHRPHNYVYRDLLVKTLQRSKKSKRQLIKQGKLLVSIRPSWPYAWIALAMAYGNGNRYGPLFRHALSTSIILGENEESLRVSRLKFAITHWKDKVPQSTRNLFVKIILDEFQRRPYFVSTYAFTKRKGHLICSLVKKDKYYSRYCKQVTFYDQQCPDGMKLSGDKKRWCTDTMKKWRSWLAEIE